MHEDVQFAVYNGSPMRYLPTFGNAGRFIYPGTAIRVTNDIRFKVLAWLNGNDSERAYFTPVDEAYFLALPRCIAPGCGVAFTRPDAQDKHVTAHRYIEDSSPEMAELRKLRADAEADKRLWNEIRERHAARKLRIAALEKELESAGYEPLIIDPNSGQKRNGVSNTTSDRNRHRVGADERPTIETATKRKRQRVGASL
jgi:hypothetical protein